MAVPKGKVSKARKHSRSANWKLTASNLSECPHCHTLIQSHRVCKNCGFYEGRPVVINNKNND